MDRLRLFQVEIFSALTIGCEDSSTWSSVGLVFRISFGSDINIYVVLCPEVISCLCHEGVLKVRTTRLAFIPRLAVISVCVYGSPSGSEVTTVTA